MNLLLPGYSGTIWQYVLATIAYGNANLNPANVASTKTLARLIAASLKNGVSAIDAGVMTSGLQTLYANLTPLLILPLTLDSTTLAYVVNRINATQAAAISAATLSVKPSPVASQIALGEPVIPDPLYAEWLLAFDFETLPTGIPDTPTGAQAEADAWNAAATALRRSGVPYTGVTLNTVQLMADTAQEVATMVVNASYSADADPAVVWNQMVTMPAITRAVDAIMNNPTSATAQATAVARYVTLNTLRQYDQLIIAARDAISSPQMSLATLRMGDKTLMTFAARALNDYTKWEAVAELNALSPPYISAAPSAGHATPGQQLFLPPTTTSNQVPTPLGGSVVSYVNNYLGIDRYLGPINQPMLPWDGDYNYIAGYPNLALSLGRRLQTTLGELIYHNLFGSRIPPEVGAIADSNLAELLAQYTTSALLSDPRVNQVVSCTVQLLGNYSAVVNAVVQPNGLGQESVTVNEVIGPP